MEPKQISREFEGNDFDHSFEAPGIREDWPSLRMFDDEITNALG
jgi:hypothetical protein